MYKKEVILNKWRKLSEEIKKCHKCKGLNDEEAGTLNAPGYGSTTSKVVIIGQSLCGNPCIKSQIPFTGGSGILLDEAFEKIEINKNDIYITNVVKCHPPNNRKSEAHEIKNCSLFLKAELEWINPTHIICLGKDAWSKFDQTIDKPTTKNKGNLQMHYIYHPSYIKRKPKEVQDIYVGNISEIIRESRNSK